MFECHGRMKTRLEESEMLGGGNLKEGFSDEGIFDFRFKDESKLVMEELQEDDSRHREEQALRAKGAKGICNRKEAGVAGI